MENLPAGKAGFMIIDTDTYEIELVSDALQRAFSALATGKTCYQCMGQAGPCPACPASRLKNMPFSIAIQHDQLPVTNSDVIAIELPMAQGHPRALLCYGELGSAERAQWLADKRYQTILRQTHTIAFEYNLENGDHFFSPFASEIFSGCYDDRGLSTIMLEDGVIHPEDVEPAVKYREEIITHHRTKELVLRLKGRDSIYRWYKMTASYAFNGNGQPMIVGTITDVDEETRLRETLRYRAEYDSLTGVWNREAYLRQMEKILRETPLQPRQIILLDINRFKTINELFGAAEGDRVLCFLAKSIRTHARPNELFGRMGNDIFSLCLLRSDDEVLDFLAQLNVELNQYPIDFNFVLCAGIFRLNHYEGQPITLLCDRAGLVQKHVKGNYLKRFAFYEDWMGELFTREHTVISSMKEAIEHQEFVAYLQPKVDMRTGRLVGAEALARWRNPREGLMKPADFIPLFEKNGFIVKLDEYIWEQACQILRSWIDAGIPPVPVSINVSRVHWYDDAFCGRLCHLLEKYDLPPSLLELELTESAYAKGADELFASIDALRRYGFKLAMDDFGTGYSSLSMLKDIPVDTLKIDLNFLAWSEHEEMGREILSAIIHLAQKLKFDVITEGVEREEQARFLLALGCTTAQGYYYDPPLPVDVFEKKYLAGTPTL